MSAIARYVPETPQPRVTWAKSCSVDRGDGFGSQDSRPFMWVLPRALSQNSQSFGGIVPQFLSLAMLPALGGTRRMAYNWRGIYFVARIPREQVS